MQVSSLIRFADLAEAGSFYQAEKRSGISAQGYAKVVRSLEKELGVTLLIRSRDGVRLTADGEILLAHARRLVRDYDDLLDALAANAPLEEKGNVVVHATFYAAESLAALMTQGLLSSALRVNEEPFSGIVDRLGDFGPDDVVLVDLYRGASPGMLKRCKATFECFAESCLGVSGSSEALAALPKRLEPSALQGAKVVYNSHREMLKMFGSVLRELPGDVSRTTFSGIEAISRYVALNPDYIAIADSLAYSLVKAGGADFAQRMRFVPFRDGETAMMVGALHSRSVALSRDALRCIRAIKRAFAGLEVPNGRSGGGDSRGGLSGDAKGGMSQRAF